MNGGCFFIQEIILLFSLLLFFCELFFKHAFTLRIFIDDWKCGRFESLIWLDVLLNLIQVAFVCSCDFWRNFGLYYSEKMPGCRVTSVDGFDECWYGRTEWRFVIELGQIYFFVAINVSIRYVLICWYWCRTSVEFKLFNII